MSDLTKKDFLYFKNDVLQDIKKVESKLTEKIGTLFSYIQKIGSSTDKRFDSMDIIIKKLSEYDHCEVENKIYSKIDELRKQLEDESIKNISKINIITKDLSTACYKYDKIVLDNLKVSGIVGEGCPYKNLKFYLEYINRKIKEIIIFKDRTYNEFNLLKETLNNINIQFQTDLENMKVQTKGLISEKYLESEKKCLERNKNVEELIKEMRLENYKYSTDLINKTEDIKIDWEKLENIKNEIYDKFNEEKNRFKKYTEILKRNFNSQKNEFIIIKSRYLQVRDIIKNLRFQKNLNDISNMNNNLSEENRNEIRSLTKKLNLFKKKKIKKKDLEKINNEIIDNNFILMESQEEEKDKNINNDIKMLINKKKSRKQKRYKSVIETKAYKISTDFVNKNMHNKEAYSLNENKEDSNIKENKEKIILNNNNDINISNYSNETNMNRNSDKTINLNKSETANEINIEHNDSFELIINEKEKINEKFNSYSTNNSKKFINNDKKDKNKLNKEEIKNNNKTKTNESSKFSKMKIKTLDDKIKNNDYKNNKNIVNNDVTVKNNRAKSNLNKNENKTNKTSEIIFSKTSYNTSKNLLKNKIIKEKQKILDKNFKSNEITKQINENEKNKEINEISDINFKNNNIRKKILENKNNQTKILSLSEDEKTFNNNILNNINNIFDSEMKEKKNNCNILRLNFEEKNNIIKENNIKLKLFYRKIIHHLYKINFFIDEKIKNFSLDIYKNFDEIKNDINKINNEINKINLKNKKIRNSELLNFKINNYDLYNNSGIELNMKNIKKKIIEHDYYSFFSRNKLIKNKQIKEKLESPRNILNNVESFLIKKFKNNKNS